MNGTDGTNGTNGTHDTNGNSVRTCDVCIVGAGPVGTYLAVRLAQAGIKVTAFESRTELADEPRAVSHMPVLFKEFEKAGILDRMKEVSRVHGGAISYRRTRDQQTVERIPPMPNRPGPLAVPQRTFTELLIAKLADSPNGEVQFGREVTSIEDSDDGVSVTVKDTATKSTQHFQCTYLIGADGARSIVRKSMGLSYEGPTLPYKLIAADIVFPFEKYGFDGANFMLDPENFGMIALITESETKETTWRVSVGFPLEMSDEAIMQALPSKFQQLFSDLKPDSYTLLKAQPYEAHQFCTSTMKQGRSILIGDAAHLCNPYSGQLLACGIFDASSLAQCLVSVLQQGAPESLLEEWNHDRVSKFRDVLDPLSRRCFEAVRGADAETIGQRHPFLKAMKAAQTAAKSGMNPGAGGAMPSLHTDVTALRSWRSEGLAEVEAGGNIELIWSKA